MALSEEFIQAVDTNQNTLTRVMISDSMLMDLTLGTFRERLEYAERNLPDLYDEHDGEVFSSDITDWDEGLLDKQMIRVVENFSRERIAFLQKLVRHVNAEKAEEADREAVIEQAKQKRPVTPTQVGIGISACGVITLIAGMATSTPAVTVTGAVIAAVGGAVIAGDQINKKKSGNA